MKWHLLHGAALQKPLETGLTQADVVFVMPATDVAQASQAANLMCARAGLQKGLLLVVLDETRDGFISIANLVFRSTRSIYFGYVAQDAFAGRNWLAIAVHTLHQQGKGLLGFNDGKWGGALAAFGLGRRTWLEQNYEGDLFFPDYTQHYADTELTVLAQGNAQYCYNPQSVLVEVDWGKDSKSVNPFDKLLFAQRKAGWLGQRVQDTACLEKFK